MTLAHVICVLLLINWTAEATPCLKCTMNILKEKIFSPYGKCAYDGYIGSDQADSMSINDQYTKGPCGDRDRLKNPPKKLKPKDVEVWIEDDQEESFDNSEERSKTAQCAPGKKCSLRPSKIRSRKNNEVHEKSEEESVDENMRIKKGSKKKTVKDKESRVKVITNKKRKTRQHKRQGSYRKEGSDYQVESQQTPTKISRDYPECSKNSKGPCSNKKKTDIPKESFNIEENYGNHESEVDMKTDNRQTMKKPKLPKGQVQNQDSQVITNTNNAEREEYIFKGQYSNKKNSKVLEDQKLEKNYNIQSEKYSKDQYSNNKKLIDEEAQGSHRIQIENSSDKVECSKNPDGPCKMKRSDLKRLPRIESQETHFEFNSDNDLHEDQGVKDDEAQSHVQLKKAEGTEYETLVEKANSSDIDCSKNPDQCKQKLSLSGTVAQRKQLIESHKYHAKNLLHTETGDQNEVQDKDQIDNKQVNNSSESDSEVHVYRKQSSSDSEVHVQKENGIQSQGSNAVQIHEEHAAESHVGFNSEKGNSELIDNHETGAKVHKDIGIESHEVHREERIEHSGSDTAHNNENVECGKNPKKPCKRILKLRGIPFRKKQEIKSNSSHSHAEDHKQQTNESHVEANSEKRKLKQSKGIESYSEAQAHEKQEIKSYNSQVEEESHKSHVSQESEKNEYLESHRSLEANSEDKKRKQDVQIELSSMESAESKEFHEERLSSTNNTRRRKSQRYSNSNNKNTKLLSAFGTKGIQVAEEDICRKNPCGLNTQCRSERGRAVCICEYGTYGNPLDICHPGSCIRDEQCDDSLSCVDGQCVDLCHKSCGINAFCQMKKHKPFCECLLGYSGNPLVECKHSEICSPNPCGANTVCKSVDGQPVCLCAPGYEGDPWKGCQHECEHDTDCAKNQACMDFTCQDACRLCGKYADCESVAVHKPVCQCPMNYYGNPYVACKPECTYHAECPRNKPTCHQFKCKNPCDGACGIQANCEIHGIEAKCTCPEHLTGNPLVYCRPFERKDFCEPFPCGKHAKCELGVDDLGKYMAVCNCLPGYYKRKNGDCLPGDCEEHFHCPEHKACIDYMCDDPCIGECGTNSFCEPHNHTAVCSCLSGYEGNPVLGCTKMAKCTSLTVCSGRMPLKLLPGK